MSFLKRLLLSLMTLLLMGFVQLPAPCQENGTGSPCTAASCTCPTSCSCQFEGCASDSTGHAGCNSMRSTVGHACVGMEKDVPPHFSLPRPLPQLLVTPNFRMSGIRSAHDRPALVKGRYDPPVLNVAEPPPRSQGCNPLA